MKTLDLACGFAKERGAIGVEKVPLKSVDVVADLTRYPYPFGDNIFDRIYLNDIIEHLPDTIKTMEEVYRMVKPNGRVLIRVVNWNSHYNAMDPTHVKTFHENSFNFFGTYKDRSYYSRARFDVVKVEYGYNELAKRIFKSKRLMKFLSHFLNNVLEDLHFELKALKREKAPESAKDSSLFEMIRCPACLGELVLKRQCWLTCARCARKYPVYDGLPVLTREEGEKWRRKTVAHLPKLKSIKRIEPLDA